jgi:Ulp1 family protease
MGNIDQKFSNNFCNLTSNHMEDNPIENSASIDLTNDTLSANVNESNSSYVSGFNRFEEYSSQVGVDFNSVVIKGFNIEISLNDLQTLKLNSVSKTFNWVNDNIIDFYLKMISYNQISKKVFTISSIFFKSIFCKISQCKQRESIDSIISSVLRQKWIDNKHLFDCDLLFIPICHGSHWFLFSIDMNKKTINHLNSIDKYSDKILPTCFNIIQMFLLSSASNSKIKFNTNEWKCQTLANLPQQVNSVDCGIFLCKYASCVAFDSGFLFDQSMISREREKMYDEISKFNFNKPGTPPFAVMSL